ncbi:MAG TPA: glycoside hydrolase family 97 protein, partial [Caldithrix sp.]|nr:glycoside hydrolase family 97 protein [Caldithrix sp.]
AATLGVDIELIGKKLTPMNETVELPFGKTKYLHNRGRELQFVFREKSGARRQFVIFARAYNDAVAFRIFLPLQPNLKNPVVVDERTSVRFPNGTAYALPLKNFQTPYENNYQTAPVEKLDSQSLYGLPFLIHLKEGPWVAVTEAALDDFPGMYLRKDKQERNTLITQLAPLHSDTTVAARLTTPHFLPWRVFMVSDNPGKFIESNVILNLSEPSKVENPCWIRPGKVAWPWWSDRVVEGRNFKGGMNTPTMKYYIDFAAEAGLEYLLIDAEWYGKHDTPDEDITTTIPEIDMPEIVKYADSRGVGVLLWLNWQCVRDQMKRAFPLYQKWGIKGVKVDYMNRDDQEMVNFYRRVAEEAARCHLVVDFHGAYKPCGLRREFPNILTREGVLGLEWSKWSKKCNPQHELILPYTRMLAGPMDFTPGSFRVENRKNFKPQFTDPMVMGTRAHQLAMYVVYESPLQMVVGHPASFFAQTGFQFIKTVPTVWDTTVFISGEVGKYIVLARKHGNEWYLGCMTDWNSREVSVPLSFLGEGLYMAQIYRDGAGADEDPEQVEAVLKEVKSSDVLKIRLAPGGGAAVRFIPTWTP